MVEKNQRRWDGSMTHPGGKLSGSRCLSSYYPAFRLRHSSFNAVNIKPFSHRTGSWSCQSLQMPHGQCSDVRTVNGEPHRRRLSANQIYWMATCLGFGLCQHIVAFIVAAKHWSDLTAIRPPFDSHSVVKVRGLGGLSPLLPFEPPAIVWAPWLNL